MREDIALSIWLCLAAYVSLGALVWIALMLGLMRRLDPLAATSPWRVRIVLAPGLIALWPLVLAMLIKPRNQTS